MEKEKLFKLLKFFMIFNFKKIKLIQKKNKNFEWLYEKEKYRLRFANKSQKIFKIY